MITEKNILSISGGKDSTAMLLLAIEMGTQNIEAVFADTGNEHQQTYDYVNYLSEKVMKIRWVKADFTERMAGKRLFIQEKWAEHGVPQEKIERALAILQPTGNPFLDLILWKGRFPSSRASFCSEELKRNVIIKQVQNPILDAGVDVVSWQGVRADESLKRRFLPEREVKLVHQNGATLENYRPILTWTAEQCFAMHKKYNIDHNPLYEQGMGRVGCMPCINVRKDELLEISKRFPEAIERIAEWELLCKDASKRDGASFASFAENRGTNIWEVVEWSKTSHGGTQHDFVRANTEPALCSSIYGLCE